MTERTQPSKFKSPAARPLWAVSLCLLSVCTPPRPSVVQVAQSNGSTNSGAGGVIIQQRAPTIPGEDAGGSVIVQGGTADAGATVVDGDFPPESTQKHRGTPWPPDASATTPRTRTP